MKNLKKAQKKTNTGQSKQEHYFLYILAPDANL